MFHASPNTRRIGLIADSHGSLSALQRSVDALLLKNVDLIVHLGDFCDSVYLDELPGVFELIQRRGIHVVKGNNDYHVEKMLRDGYSKFNQVDGNRWLQFLQNVPIRLELDSLWFAHSLPYDSIRSFYEPVDTGSTNQAEQVFENADFQVLFCGHSHMPILFRLRSGRVTREPMLSGRRVGIEAGQRYIFIIGSADKGECGFFDLTDSFYERVRV